MKEGKGDFRTVFESDESLMNKKRGEGNAMELKRRFHGVKWIVVLEE